MYDYVYMSTAHVCILFKKLYIVSIYVNNVI